MNIRPFVAFCLALAFIFPFPILAKGFELVTVEAENYIVANPPWSFSEEGPAGDPAGTLAADTGDTSKGIEGAQSALYLVDFPSSGLYSFHARTYDLSETDTPAAIYVGMGDSWTVAASSSAACQIYDSWMWTGVGDEGGAECARRSVAHVFVTQPGLHEIRLGTDRTGIAIDRLAFVRDIPTDSQKCQLNTIGDVVCSSDQQSEDEYITLAASFSDTLNEIEVGEFATVELRVDNTSSNATASNVELMFAFGEELEYQAHTGCECQTVVGGLRCEINTLWADEAVSCQAELLVGSGNAVSTSLTVLADEPGTFVGMRREIQILGTDLASKSTKGTAAKVVENSRGCVGNLVWEDIDGDGIKRGTERGFEDVSIALVDFSGNLVDSVISPNGYYELCATAGNYLVQVDVPDGYRVAPVDNGNSDFNDSDADPDGRIPVTVQASKNNGRFDVGLVTLESSSSAIEDVDSDEFNVVDSSNDLVDAEGCVGNLVWLDKNGDGRRDGAEPGVGGVSVVLEDAFDGVVDSDETSSGGFYTLCALPGEYTVRVVVPADAEVTQRDAVSSDFHDSDAGVDGAFMVFVNAGTNNQRFDIGLIAGTTVADDAGTGLGTEPASDTDTASITGAAVDEVLFGPWVQPDDVVSRGVFGRFNAALVQWVRPDNVLSVIEDARRTGTRIIFQLGTQGDWGYDINTRTSTFTVAKWEATVDRFGKNARINREISDAIADGTIRGIYLIDEPQHPRWSPSGSGHTHISNADLDYMAGHVKSYWPGVRTSVRSSARTLFQNGRDQIQWRHLDEVFVMIQYRMWSQHGQERTIEEFMEREMRDAQTQGLDVIGGVQMLIGAPTSNREFWPAGSGMQPVGQLKVSPVELVRYVEAFLQPRNLSGEIDLNGSFRVRDVMVFRWDRNAEQSWANQHYDEAISRLISWTVSQ